MDTIPVQVERLRVRERDTGREEGREEVSGK
jgi:hypothetical protein